MWHRHGGWLGVTFAHARSKERGGVGCVIVVREYGLGRHAPVFVGRCCCQGFAYAVIRSKHRLWSPAEVFASVICLQHSSVSLSSRSLSSIEQAQPPSLSRCSTMEQRGTRVLCGALEHVSYSVYSETAGFQ